MKRGYKPGKVADSTMKLARRQGEAIVDTYYGATVITYDERTYHISTPKKVIHYGLKATAAYNWIAENYYPR